jgi:hypothetical protein
MNILNVDSNAIQDLVIASMLAERSTSQDNIDPENEIERRRRLQTLLKTSKKYRRLSVKLANDQWEALLASNDGGHFAKASRTHRVSFSDTVQVIPESNPRRIPESLNKIIKIIFKLGRV